MGGGDLQISGTLSIQPTFLVSPVKMQKVHTVGSYRDFPEQIDGLWRSHTFCSNQLEWKLPSICRRTICLGVTLTDVLTTRAEVIFRVK